MSSRPRPSWRFSMSRGPICRLGLDRHTPVARSYLAHRAECNDGYFRLARTRLTEPNAASATVLLDELDTRFQGCESINPVVVSELGRAAMECFFSPFKTKRPAPK